MFDDIIKDKANNHEAPVPPGAWDNIVHEKKKRRFGFFWWSSIAILLAGLSVAGYFINSKTTGNNIVTAESKSTATKDKTASNETLQKPAIKTTDEINVTAPKNNASESNENTAAALTTASNNTRLTNGKAEIKNIAATPEDMDNGIATDENGTPGNQSTVSSNTQKRKTKAQVKYSNTGAQPETIITAVEDDQSPRTNNNNQTVQAGIIKNTSDDNKEQLNTTAIIEKPAAIIKEEKKTTVENKKESTTLTKQSNKHHWFIDAGITPLLPVQQYDEHISFNRTLLLNNNRSVFTAQLQSSTIDPSMAFSIAVRREFNKKILLGIGLQYLLLKESIRLSGHETNTAYSVVQRLVNGTNGPELINDTVATVTEGTRDISAVNSYHLFSIPVFLQYKIVQKRSWSLSPVAGIYINISSSYQNEIDRNAAAPLTATTEAVNKTNIGLDLFAGLRFDKTVGTRVDFFALPAMRWNLKQYNIKNSLINKTIHQAGLSVGVSYKMN